MAEQRTGHYFQDSTNNFGAPELADAAGPMQEDIFRPRLHGNHFKWNRTKIGTGRRRVYMVLMEPFQKEPLVVPEHVHLERRSRMERNQKALM